MLKFRLIKLKRISNQTKVQIVFNLCKSEITDIKKTSVPDKRKQVYII